MSITLNRIRELDSTPQICELYISSFPDSERRDLTLLNKLLKSAPITLYEIQYNNSFAGFITIWNFPLFLFVEHFAINTALRGAGIGSKTINIIITNNLKPIVLEVEPPIDDISKKRVEFYNRSGLQLSEEPYIQPSYDGVKPEVELRLMCTNFSFLEYNRKAIVKTLHTEVYSNKL
ncbi:MAG: GNAT family N-acetyltransferase [Bacteroidales bacterium]|nr:GNAT family N-acetyltransferase [Bacteroidales bacterium]MBN2749564.1 GNAT family N-acetyltransferase [Bacteroidales bacterium]